MRVKKRFWSFLFSLILMSGFALYKIAMDPQKPSVERLVQETQQKIEEQAKTVLGSSDDKKVDLNGLEVAQVKRIVDGDTIELTDGRKLRYIGMDTPETHHPTKGVQCFGQEAAELNRQLVEGKTVQLEKDVSETDRYGRLLRYVWLDGKLVNTQLVADGYAFARSYPPDIARQQELRQAEKDARQNSLGLWKQCPSLWQNE
jgi:micrococcal nuclease